MEENTMSSTTQPFVEFAEIAREVSASLRYLAGLGCRGADCSRQTLAVVRSWDLTAIRLNLMQCRRCRLAENRKRVVFGRGNHEADIVFVRGVPEPEDVQTGMPGSGPAGELLTRIIAAMHLDLESVYITCAVKCRPAGRIPEAAAASGGVALAAPAADEGADIDDAVCHACRWHLMSELMVIKPRIICALGDLAARSLSTSGLPFNRLRGRFFLFKGAQVMATFSPEHILVHPSAKRTVWEDMKKIMAALAEV
jgi:uracil-DNA glycosylase